MAQSNEKILKIVLAVLAAGLAVVIGFVIRREVIRNQALKNIGKNTIEVAVTETDVKKDAIAQNNTEKSKQAEDAQKKDMALIQDFYDHVLDIVPGKWDVKKYLSSGLAKRIWETEYENTYSIWEFRTGFQDGPENTSKIISITPTQDGWYEVAYSDMGNKGKTLVHMSKGVIDDYKRIEPKSEFI